MKPIDLAILGGGCAGLSLARDIARLKTSLPSGHRVVVLEPRTRYDNDRTWCFWSTGQDAEDPLVSRRWAAWRFSCGGNEVVHRSADSQYCLISAADFYRDAFDTIDRAAGIDLRRGVEVTAVEPIDNGFRVQTTAGELVAANVVDSRPAKKRHDHEALFFQAFEGVEIECEHAIGDPHVAGLMDHMCTDQHSFCFDYVLPLGPGRWLIEATRFSPVAENETLLSRDLEMTLSRLIPSGEFRRLRHEQGTIPMGGLPPQPTGSVGWVRAGTVGGAVRSASGYAYRRIQQWSQDCARQFVASGKVSGQPRDSSIRRGMDDLFLRVIRHDPKLAPELFLRLARGMQPDAMARFMVDQARGTDLMAVVKSLPKIPFLKQLLGRRPPLSNLPKKDEAA